MSKPTLQEKKQKNIRYFKTPKELEKYLKSNPEEEDCNHIFSFNTHQIFYDCEKCGKKYEGEYEGLGTTKRVNPEEDKGKKRKPTHGPCCTCQTCGWHYDDCICDDTSPLQDKPPLLCSHCGQREDFCCFKRGRDSGLEANPEQLAQAKKEGYEEGWTVGYLDGHVYDEEQLALRIAVLKKET